MPVAASEPVPLGQPGKFEFCPAARPLLTIPAPPLPRVLQTAPSAVATGPRNSESESISSSAGESLNPDVPEFVPVVMAASKLASESALNHRENNRPKDEESSKPERRKTDDSDDPMTNSVASSKRDESSRLASKSNSVQSQVNGTAEPTANDVWKEVRLQ